MEASLVSLECSFLEVQLLFIYVPIFFFKYSVKNSVGVQKVENLLIKYIRFQSDQKRG